MASSPPTTSATREHIMRVARHLIRTRSFLGFSFQDIADEVGIRKASIYHHFPSKEALGIAVLRAAVQDFKDWAATTPEAPHAKLEAFFQMYRDSLRAGQGVCPGGAFAPGWDCINDELRRTVRDLRDSQILWLTGVLGGMGMQSDSVSQLAALVFSTCQGALVSARISESVEDFDQPIGRLRSLLAR